jgi:hypothetical protein
MIVTMVERRHGVWRETNGRGQPKVRQSAADCSRDPRSGRRVEYVKSGGDVFVRVAADFFTDGRESFSENEEFDDVRWFAYVPSSVERRVARRMLATDMEAKPPLLLFFSC